MSVLHEIQVVPTLYRGLPEDRDLLTVLLLSTCVLDCPGLNDDPQHIDCMIRANAAFEILRGNHSFSST